MLLLDGLIDLAVEEGFVYLYKHGKGRLVSAPLEAAIQKFGEQKVLEELSPKLEVMINNTLSNYSRIKRSCAISQDPTSCYMTGSVIVELETIFENFEYGMGILKVWKVEDPSNGEPFLIIRKKDVDQIVKGAKYGR